MPSPLPPHRIIPADAYSVPAPFQTFAVRSEEPRHGGLARAPYRSVHVVPTKFLDAAGLGGLAAMGHARMQLDAFSDIDYAEVTLDELAAAAPHVDDLVGQIAAALQLSGVLGSELRPYRDQVAARIDYLGCRGAGFHNDVSRHWTGCLFWNLALEMADVEFVMPHAGVRMALHPGDLIVFDQTMAHGLCRPRDKGQALAASFESGDDTRQVFLSGELALTDAQWAALGSPWLAVEDQHRRGALELMAAEFDEHSGAIKRVRSLQDCMLRSTCYAMEGSSSAKNGAHE
jgi:hypothetical protein